MKIALVYPRFEKFLTNNPELDSGLVKYFLGDFTTPPSLGIPILAALTPADVQVDFIDDNSGDEVDYSVQYDLVGINCFTPQATRAFEIADGFRQQGNKVIMGGFFPSFMVEECLKHCDSVNVGEAEPTWRTILEDVKNNQLKKVYKGGCKSDPSSWVIPKRDIFYHKRSYEWEEDLIQLSRGCKYNCAMCAIPAHMGFKMRFKPIDMVVDELKTLKYENVYLADDSLFFTQSKIEEYARELFKKVKPLNKKFFVSSTVALNCDPDFLTLAADAGVKNFYCTMNVDPFSIRALQGDKTEQQKIIDLVKMLEDRDIRFFGSCAIGRDWDDESIADRILDLYHRAGIQTSEFFIFTPYPGSVHWNRLLKQKRIIDTTWKRYNGAHVVFKPQGMSPDQLYGQFIKVWNEFFKSQKDQNLSSLEPSTYENGIKVVGKPLKERGVKGESAVTGMGIISPIGNTKDELLDALRRSKSGIDTIKKIDMTHFKLNHGGEIKEFDPDQFFSKQEQHLYSDRYLQYAIVSMKKAIEDAGLEISDLQDETVGIVLSTCNGGLLTGEELYKWKHGKSDNRYNEKMNTQAQYYGFGRAISSYFGLNCEVWIVTTACSSSTGAIGLAKTLIDRGYCKTVIVGGSDAMVLSNIAGFDALGGTSSEPVAPFSLPIGLNVGEASCFWVVEEMEKAILRKVKCYARIAGHSTTLDAHHPTAPEPGGDGIFRALKNALQDSGYEIDDLKCINAHGTGTEANDKAESRGIMRFIGERNIPAISLKSFFGHCMGTTGILEATCNILAMNEGFIPPTINFTQKRPGCDLDYNSNVKKTADYDFFISGNSAFGGNYAAAVLSRWDKPIVKREQKNDRVVITGAGLISSLGNNIETTVKALSDGKRGFSSDETVCRSDLTSTLGGFVPPFSAKDINRRLDFRKLSNKISKMASAAAYMAIEQAGLKPNRKNAEDFGVVVGVCNGPPEIDHMDKVFSSQNYAADTTSFSNITANSIAGWVANLLCLKGVNTTLSPGPHSALQAAAYAFDAITLGRVKQMVVGGTDEIDRQTYFNYDLIDYLYSGEQEQHYRYRQEESRKKVLGEGSAMLVMESLEQAQSRAADILGEVKGYAMNCDCDPFGSQCMSPDQLHKAMDKALLRSGITKEQIDLVVWAPQGNSQDDKVLDVYNQHFKPRKVPVVTNTFNTGYIESCSVLSSLGCVLYCLHKKMPLWRQITGIECIDSQESSSRVKRILVLSSTDLGYNYSLVVEII